MKTLRRKIRRTYEWSRDKLNGAVVSDEYFFASVGPATLPALREQLRNLGRSLWLNAPLRETEIVAAANEICQHIFDLLGSGKVKVHHNLQAQGFAGHCYHMPISNDALQKKYRRLEKLIECSIDFPLDGGISANASPHISKPLNFGYELIDWLVDFKSGYRWNEKLWHQRVPTGHVPGADIKVPWELSRMQQLSVLGQAYQLTNDSKYAREFAFQILDWISNNPQTCGLNWARAMEVALRAMNWIFSAHFFMAAPELRESFWKELLKSLYQHGEFIMRHLEISRDQNGNRLTANHYLANIAGLVLLGILFRATRAGSAWLEFGVRELHAEMASQVYADGVHFEASTHYHQLVTELFLCATLAASREGMHFAPAYLDRLDKMIEFILHTTKPDGSRPLIGDNDDGGLVVFRVSNNASSNCRSEGILLSRLHNVHMDFVSRAEKDSSRMTWRGHGRLENELSSQAFPESGLYVLRHHDDYMIVDCGPCGQSGNGGHAHNDTLSFELTARGANFIVDPGTFTYTASAELRNAFRSTAFHNTVVVDHEEMNEFQSHALFCLKETQPPQVLKFETASSHDYLEAQHFGYCRLPDPIVHRRQILFNKTEHFWVIKDLLLGNATHEYFFHLHFAPLAVRIIADELMAVAESSGVALAVFPFDKEHVRMRCLEGSIASQYGRRVSNTVVQYAASARAPFAFTTVFFACKDEQFNLASVRTRVQAFCESINKSELLQTEQSSFHCSSTPQLQHF
ncbi:alginate lyase family protein [candidate division KSB1 bacterium]|nr:alginate lyase family protein [candidate division KSB1 bacterium]